MKRFQEVTFSRVSGYSWILLGHVALAYLICFSSWTLLLVSFCVTQIITTVGLGATYHRVVSHNAAKIPKILEYIGVFIGGLSMQGSALSWSATHRQHHKYQGTERDPHSPKYLGAWYVQLFGYAFSKIDPRFAASFIGTYHATWHKYYYWIYAPVLFGSLAILPFDVAIAVFWAPIAMAFHFEGLTNTSTHSWNRDVPANKMWVNAFMFCEGWHKTHHDSPGLVRLSKYDAVGFVLQKLHKKK
jgi:fatty-acid desaturase